MIEVTVVYQWWLQDEINDLLFSKPVETSADLAPYTTDCTLSRASIESINCFSLEFLSLFPLNENLSKTEFGKDELQKLDERLIWIEIKTAS